MDEIADIDKPDSTDLQPLIQCTKSDKWLIRHSAIRSLRKSASPSARQAVLEIISKTTVIQKYKDELIYANSVLSDIGHIEDIPVLEGMLSAGIRYIRESARYAIDCINERNKVKENI